MFKCEYKINVSEGAINKASVNNAPYPKSVRVRLSTLSGDPIHYFGVLLLLRTEGVVLKYCQACIRLPNISEGMTTGTREEFLARGGGGLSFSFHRATILPACSPTSAPTLIASHALI